MTAAALCRHFTAKMRLVVSMWSTAMRMYQYAFHARVQVCTTLPPDLLCLHHSLSVLCV